MTSAGLYCVKMTTIEVFLVVPLVWDELVSQMLLVNVWNCFLH